MIRPPRENFPSHGPERDNRCAPGHVRRTPFL